MLWYVGAAMKRDVKICYKCNRELDLSSFHKDSTKPDGLNIYCKECRKSHYKDNIERYKENSKRYYQDNIERFKEYNKKYYEDNKSYFLYFIYEQSEIVYIGSCVSKNRFSNHINGHSSIGSYMKLNRWTSIKYIEMEDLQSIEELRLCEKICIDEICPSLNKNMPIQELKDKARELEVAENIYYLVDNLEEFTTEYKTNNK